MKTVRYVVSAPSPLTQRLDSFREPPGKHKHFTPKQNTLGRAEFEEFISLYKPGAIHKRKATRAEDKPDGRWRCFDYDDLLKSDKLSLDLFWIKDESVEDSSTLPDPDVLAQEIVDDLEDALERFTAIAGALKVKG